MVVSSGQRQMLSCQRLLQLCWQSLLRDPAEQPAAVSRMSTDHPSLTGAGPDVDAMKAVGKAHQHRSLHEFQATLKSYHHELQGELHQKQPDRFPAWPIRVDAA